MRSTAQPTLLDQRRYWDARWERTPSPNAWQRKRADAVLEMIRPLNLKNRHILDVGCATGWFTRELSHFGAPRGVDLSEHAIEIARQCFPDVPFEAGDFFKMRLPANYFGLVVSQEVVAHVPDQKEFVRRLAEITVSGGHLVITMANKFVVERANFGPDDRAHIKQWLSARELKGLLRAAGFRVLKKKYVIPLAGRGVLRIADSWKLNAALRLAFSQDSLDRMKERLGLGYSVIMLAVKE